MSANKFIINHNQRIREFPVLELSKSNSKRVFSSRPRVYESKNYNHLLWLEFNLKNPLPNRKNPVRNHYAMYYNVLKESLIFCKCETTVVYPYTDIAMDVDVINIKTGAYCANENWSISYDKIEYTRTTGDVNYTDLHLISGGEWWWFDKGLVFNGINRDGLPHFGYVELLNIQQDPNNPGRLISVDANYNKRDARRNATIKNLGEQIIKEQQEELKNSKARNNPQPEDDSQPQVDPLTAKIDSRIKSAFPAVVNKIKFSGAPILGLQSFMPTNLQQTITSSLAPSTNATSNIPLDYLPKNNTPILPDTPLLDAYYNDLNRGSIDGFVNDYYIPKFGCPETITFDELARPEPIDTNYTYYMTHDFMEPPINRDYS